MKFKITEATNFIRIFQLPDDYPKDYCFGGGFPVHGLIIKDWFNPFDQQLFWEKEEIIYEETDLAYSRRCEEIRNFVKTKKYYNPNKDWLAITDYGDAFVINPERKATELENQLKEIKAKMLKDNK